MIIANTLKSQNLEAEVLFLKLIYSFLMDKDQNKVDESKFFKSGKSNYPSILSIFYREPSSYRSDNCPGVAKGRMFINLNQLISQV